MAEDKFSKALKAWHASPYDFEKFGPVKEVSGSGQGAASYGRGLYVAESPKVSGPGESEYMQEFSRHPAVLKQIPGWHTRVGDTTGDGNYKDLGDFHPVEDSSSGLHDMIYYVIDDNEAFKNSKTLDVILSLFASRNRYDPNFLRDLSKKSKSDAADFLNSDLERTYPGQGLKFTPDQAGKLVRRAGNTKSFLFKEGKPSESLGPYSYELKVHLQPETILDWDSPLEDHHPEAAEKIYDLLRQRYPNLREEELRSWSDGGTNYDRLVKALGSDVAASEALYNAGIHGIRYEDGMSRGVRKYATLDGKSITNAALRDSGLEDPGDQAVVHAYLNTANTMEELEDLFENHNVSPTVESWWKTVKSRITPMTNPTYNYVVFHPDLVEAVAQYNIKGEKTKDFGPGVHLKSVDHDPFEGEK